MDSSGNLYGSTLAGGAYGYGTVFEIAHGSDTITTLASFNLNNVHPGGLVMDGSGNLYGITGGGAYGDGSVFELAKGSGTITTLASFDGTGTNNGNGESPSGLIMDGSGNLYGTTTGDGSSRPTGDGTVFEVAKGSGTITTLADFDGYNGFGPNGGLIMDGSGNLYGTTERGGASSGGTVFELAKGSDTITTLGSFNVTNGSDPESGLVMDGSGNLYGTTYSGGAYFDLGLGQGAIYGGTVFEVAKGSDTITTLTDFDGYNGFGPNGGLIMDGSGNLYSTTSSGGPYFGPGGLTYESTVFEVAKGSDTITTLAYFDDEKIDGGEPASLVMNSSGNLYGTALYGGTYNDGTVFELQATQLPQLVIFQQPSNTVAGATMATVTVTIEDQFGNIETGDNSDTISLAIGPNSPSGTLNGTLTETVSGGVATFSDLSINQAGNGYMLAASSPTNTSLANATSNAFNIAPASASNLVFMTQPSNTAAGATITPAVTVLMEDQYGNVETSDSTDQVSLAIGTNPSSGILNGMTTQTVSDGEATFGNLSISSAGNGYTLAASSTINNTNLSATSNAFDITSSGPTDISSDLNVAVGGHHLVIINGKRYVDETLTITNTSDLTFLTGISLVLTNLSKNATLSNGNGTYNGNPYLDIGTPSGGLAHGQSMTVDLLFLDPTLQAINFGTEEYEGEMSGNS